ncbi:sodium-coupled monocarboxylate transporter 1-like [Oratosquilla oratoria]|uniref:sodium-coupled monocarboxylate transporter 1-like n=1 Tax=Oratosquilla oratoria TaxID=337810 RepID=UPI003F75A843
MGWGTVDIVLFVISIIISAGIGIYHSVKGIRATPSEYMLGDRGFSPLPLAASLTVGTISALTILGNAGEVYTHGTQIWMMDIGVVAGMVVVAKYFVPIFYPLKMVSLYQYVEKRFKSSVLRQATAILTLIGAYLFLGFLIYPPAIILQASTGLSIHANMFIMGTTCTAYAAFGGVKAVVYADVFQSVVMLVGILTIVIQGTVLVGGLDNVWEIGFQKDRVEFFNLSLDPYERHSLWLVIILGFFFTLNTYGVTQSQMQRAFSTGSIRQSQKVMYYGAVGLVVIRGLTNLSGLVIFANFVDCDPLTSLNLKKPGLVVLSYVLQKLTIIPGLAGLFVAAIYSAVLSSVSTQVNSMTALIWEDFLKGKKCFEGWSPVKIGHLQKCIVAVSGVVGILMGFLAESFSTLMEAVLSILGVFAGPMVGLFLVAVFLPWVNIKGASFGFVSASIFSMWIGVSIMMGTPPKFLPLSVEGCPPPPTTNTTTTTPNITTTTTTLLDDAATTSVLNITDISTTTPPVLPEEEASAGGFNGLYQMSYCLNSMWSTLIFISVAIVVTVIWGGNSPEDLDERLVDAGAWRLFTQTVPRLRKEGFRSLLPQRKPTISKRAPGGGEGTTGGVEEEQLQHLNPNSAQMLNVSVEGTRKDMIDT